MKASVERLRWMLAGAAVLLLLVLGIFLGYGRYRALKNWQRILARSGIHITHETDGYTFSQSSKGRTIFTLHAAKAIQLGDGKWALHDAVLTLFGKTGDTVDHIYGKDFEYDEKTGVARALGEVLMDVQAPVSAKEKQVTAAKAADRIIHVRTSGLVYVRKLAVAATDQQVEFRYGDMQCLAKGAEFDTGENILRLLADVRMNGEVRGEAVTLNAAKADLNRQTNTIALVQPVAAMRGQMARASTATVELRIDGSIDHAQADGAVTMDAGTRHIAAQHMEGTFSTTSEPQFVRMLGGVTLSDTRAERPLQGHARQVDASFNATGAPTSIVATGGAGLGLSQQRAGEPALARELRGDRIVATLLPLAHGNSSQLSEVHAFGAAMVSGDSIPAAQSGSKGVTPKDASALNSMQMFADDLDGVFDTKSKQKTSLQRVVGHGHTRLLRSAPSGERDTTAGDSLTVVLAPEGADGVQVVSAVQSGNVQMHSVAAPKATGAEPVVSDASADTASFEAGTDKLTLEGHPRFTQPGTLLTATSIAIEQHLGDVDARGDVLATLQNIRTGAAAAQATHVSADHAHLAHASGLAEFYGSDKRPARLWQDASQVEAANLLFDQKKHTLAARPETPGGVVHATFASAAHVDASAEADQKKAGQVLRVASAAMDYDGTTRAASFRDGVRMDGATGQARSQRAAVFLHPLQTSRTKAEPALPKNNEAVDKGDVNPFGGSLDRVALTGDVRIDQPGRVGTGDELIYTAADSSYVLTGTSAKPPRIVDAQQGNVTGATLLFSRGDNTIIVAGAPATSSKAKPGRVRSETEVPQRNEVRQ